MSTFQTVPVCKLRPVLPQNFLIDPVAVDVDSALGVAIDEFVPTHAVETASREGCVQKCAV